MRRTLRILVVLAAALATVLPLHAADGDSQFEFTGTIESTPYGTFTGSWTISGRTVHVSAATEIDQQNGPATVGAFVRVRGALRADGTVDATRIEVRTAGDAGGAAARFTAVVESMPAGGFVGDWTVGGRTVHVSAATRIVQTNGVPAVGSTVDVHGTERTDGSVDADEIEVRSGGGNAGGTGEDVHVFGLVEALPAGSPPVGTWTVAGRSVLVSATTVLNAEGGLFAVGAYIEAEGTLNTDGSIAATKIELRRAAQAAGSAPVSFQGTVELLPSSPGWIGDWRVGGRSVVVGATTDIEQEHGAIALGALVEVHGTPASDGSLVADRIEVEWGPATTGSSLTNTWILPSSARAHGQGDAFYTTNLTISNTGAADASLILRLLGHDRDGRTGPEKSLSLAAGATITIEDVLASAFGVGDDYGAILVSSNVATLVVESTTSTPGSGGEFGQGLRATSRNELLGGGDARSLVGVRDDSRFRTNLVLANAVETEIDVDLNLFGDDGRPLGSLRVHLEPLGMRQVNEVSRALGAGTVTGARLVLSTPTAGGAFAAYASVIDRGTNDPRVLSPR